MSRLVAEDPVKAGRATCRGVARHAGVDDLAIDALRFQRPLELDRKGIVRGNAITRRQGIAEHHQAAGQGRVAEQTDQEQAGADGPNRGGSCATVTSGGSPLSSQVTRCSPEAVLISVPPADRTPELISAVTAATVACTHIRISCRAKSTPGYEGRGQLRPRPRTTAQDG